MPRRRRYYVGRAPKVGDLVDVLWSDATAAIQGDLHEARAMLRIEPGYFVGWRTQTAWGKRQRVLVTARIQNEPGGSGNLDGWNVYPAAFVQRIIVRCPADEYSRAWADAMLERMAEGAVPEALKLPSELATTTKRR